MRNTQFKSIAFGGLLLSSISSAFALPTLQLDIDNGIYIGGSEESTITSNNIFTLTALANASGNVSASDILADEFFISIAITPKQIDAADLGSFWLNGTEINATDNNLWIDGTPPSDVEDAHGGIKELGSHGIFDTYYYEHAFQFNGSQTVSAYNVEDDTTSSGDNLFAMNFEFDISNLSSEVELHFDLYNVAAKKGEATLDDFAPFSHDAGTDRSTPPPVVDAPEPTGLAAFGLILLGLTGLRKKAK